MGSQVQCCGRVKMRSAGGLRQAHRTLLPDRVLANYAANCYTARNKPVGVAKQAQHCYPAVFYLCGGRYAGASPSKPKGLCGVTSLVAQPSMTWAFMRLPYLKHTSVGVYYRLFSFASDLVQCLFDPRGNCQDTLRHGGQVDPPNGKCCFGTIFDYFPFLVACCRLFFSSVFPLSASRLLTAPLSSL